MTTANIYSYAVDDGETIDAYRDHEIGQGFFLRIREANPNAANVRIELPAPGWSGHDACEFPLRREPKTLGTYATRFNKILAGDDPDEREEYSLSSGHARALRKDGEIQRDGDGFRLDITESDYGSGYAEGYFNADGELVLTHVENFRACEYHLTGLTNPRYGNRNAKLVQRDADGNVCRPPETVLAHGGKKVSLPSDPSDDEIAAARGELAKILATDGDFESLATIEDATPETVGGGEEWLGDYLSENRG